MLELDERFELLRAGQVVIDCGASPGSWSQVAVKKVNADGHNSNEPQGLVISIDKQPIFHIEVSLRNALKFIQIIVLLGCNSIR